MNCSARAGSHDRTVKGEHMNATSDTSALARLARACSRETTRKSVLGAALPTMMRIAGAHAAVVVRQDKDGHTTPASAGYPVDTGCLTPMLEITDEDGWSTPPVPEAWSALGIQQVLARRLPGAPEVLVLARTTARQGAESDELEVAAALLSSAVGRRQSEEDLSDLAARVDNAQSLAGMGDYDWDIATDTNRWSDQLYRIYGHEPQSFNASYERFLSLIHEDDRETIMGIHQAALASGEPYQMIERIIRPTGEMRYLSSNGQVVMNEAGQPARMRGTCIDITDRVLAEEERARSADRFVALVQSSPDMILVVEHGQIVQANPAALEVLGGDPVGHSMDEITAIDQPVGRAVPATGMDGRALQLDYRTTPLGRQDNDMIAVFLHDAEPRLAREAFAANLREAQLRQRQAVEINDNVVQGLTAATYALESEDHEQTTAYVRQTLTSARKMMTDLMEPLDGQDVHAGDLVRTTASVLDAGVEAPPPYEPVGHEPGDGNPRVLIVDDSADLRTLLRLQVERKLIGHVVGEAVDGHEGVELAETLQPDLVLLDLAMPRMDGLQALPLIRKVAPRAKIIMLSGFDQQRMSEQVLQGGASRYVEKGTSMARLVSIIREVWESDATPASA